MNDNTGVWIDRTQAILVTLSGAEEKLETILSKVAHQPRRAGGSVSRRSEPIPPDDKAKRAYQRHLNQYYDRVVPRLRGNVLVFGPGAAKGELRKRIERRALPGVRIVGLETTEHMTARQVRQRVKRYFLQRN